MSSPTFRWLEIESFRGFRDRQRLNLDASVVVLSGSNGTGKTSFFDAVQWLLTGQLARLEQLRFRKTDEHIVNAYRAGRPAVVEAELTIGEEHLRLRRSGNHESSLFEVHRSIQGPLYGDKAESLIRDALLPQTEIDLSSALLTSGLLQQDAMRIVLDSKPSDQYTQLSRMMGLGILEDFESQVVERSKRLKRLLSEARQSEKQSREAIQATRDRLAAAQMRVSRRADAQATRHALSEVVRARREWIEPAEIPVDPSAVQSLLLAARSLYSSLSALAQRRAQAVAMQSRTSAQIGNRPSVEQVNAQQSLIAQIRARAASIRSEEQSASDSAAALTRLAATAIPLLTQVCPVCEQRINAEVVRRTLESRSNDVRRLTDLQTKRLEIERELVDAERRAREQDAAIRAAEQAAMEHATATQGLADVTDQVRRGAQNQSVLSLSALNGDSDLGVALEVLTEFGAALAAYAEALRGTDPDSEVSVLDAELRDLEARLANREEAGQFLVRESNEATALATAARDARLAVIEGRFAALEPVVLDIYQRLDPHPTFKRLSFQHDLYYARGTTAAYVEDDLAETTARPQLVFSSAQANIVALTYFLATGLALGSQRLPFLLLDDPLQSLDAVNVLGFTDLCRFMRVDRQLVISTHDTRLADLLERKLAPRSSSERTVSILFESWDRSGPSVQTRFVESQLQEAALHLVAS